MNISAKGDKEAIGGHIHFGCKVNGIVSKLFYTSELTKVFDKFLGSKFVSLSGKARGGFGVLGNGDSIRGQHWGFEYRVLPAAIFQNPKIVKIVLILRMNSSFIVQVIKK